MTPSFEASTHDGYAAQPSLSTLQTNRLRMALLVGREERTAEFRHHADMLVSLTADSSDDTTGRERAMAALRMFVAREAIEEIQDSLLRMLNGDYGTCQSCGQPIALARLEVFPRARCCTACSTASTLAGGAEKTPGKRITMNPEREGKASLPPGRRGAGAGTIRTRAEPSRHADSRPARRRNESRTS